MTYIDDDSIVKCNLDKLYSGDLLLEGNLEVGDIIGYAEDVVKLPGLSIDSYLAQQRPIIDPLHLAQTPPPSGTLQGWDSVDRICGD